MRGDFSGLADGEADKRLIRSFNEVRQFEAFRSVAREYAAATSLHRQR
jgi:hypothetical protein